MLFIVFGIKYMFKKVNFVDRYIGNYILINEDFMRWYIVLRGLMIVWFCLIFFKWRLSIL